MIDRNEKTAQQKLDVILYGLEQMVYRDMGYLYINGGYAKATSEQQKDRKYKITLEYGVENDSTNYKCVEYYKYDIKHNRLTDFYSNKKWRKHGQNAD